jgi:tRNA uridine 5-carboxymethylaminomethyl modification enzyme
LKRAEVRIEDLMEWISDGLRSLAPAAGATPEVGEGFALPLSPEEARRIETEFKYEGYLVQQAKQIEQMKRAETRRIPEWFDYRQISGLSREMVEKLTRVRPLTLGQALRIPGVTPAAVSLVNVYIEIFQRRSAEGTDA